MTVKSIDITGQFENYHPDDIRFAATFLTEHLEHRPPHCDRLYRVNREIVFESYLILAKAYSQEILRIEFFEKLACLEFPTLIVFSKTITKQKDVRMREPQVTWYKGTRFETWYRIEPYLVDAVLWENVRFYQDKLGGNLVFGDIC